MNFIPSLVYLSHVQMTGMQPLQIQIRLQVPAGCSGSTLVANAYKDLDSTGLCPSLVTAAILVQFFICERKVVTHQRLLIFCGFYASICTLETVSVGSVEFSV